MGDSSTSFTQICPECGMSNLEDASVCMMCGKNLEDTLLYLEEDRYDLELTPEYLIEYRKKFWGQERSGKIKKFKISSIECYKMGSPISRFIFIYKGKREVLPMEKNNLDRLLNILKDILQ